MAAELGPLGPNPTLGLPNWVMKSNLLRLYGSFFVIHEMGPSQWRLLLLAFNECIAVGQLANDLGTSKHEEVQHPMW